MSVLCAIRQNKSAKSAAAGKAGESLCPSNFFSSSLWFFSHLIADYNLQGILADLKQRLWWDLKYSKVFVQEHYPVDYITALIEHSFMWSTCITIPLLVYSLFVPYNSHAIVYFCSAILTNAGFHAIIDHQKANEGSISLTTEQLLHTGLIFFTWLFFVLFY